jgi:N,N'-diacetyllegionaminate synthase
MPPLALGGRLLGEGQPCLVAAHVGHAHEGRVADALRLIEAAFQAGADAIVFSVFRAGELVVRRHPERAELEALELSDADWARVLEAARASGLAVIAEVHDHASLDLACRAQVDAVQSDARDLDHPELLRTLGRSGRPLLVATGGAGETAVRAALDASGGCTALLLGPALAPAAVEELRLGEIAAVRERLRVSTGLLDPTDGGSAFALVVPALAAALGAHLVEKRLVLDRTRKRRDGAAALAPEELYRSLELLRQGELARGDGTTRPAAGAPRGRSIVAATLIGRGEVLTLERLRFKRTDDRLGRGLTPAEAERVIGRRAARPIQADETIREEMLE